MAPAPDFATFFQQATGFRPYAWQEQVACQGLPEILPVPTGFGKTEGAVLAWAWRRIVQRFDAEPLHLVYCLPMRTLVRQTVQRLEACFDNLAAHVGQKIPVYQLMAGSVDEEWAGKPDQPWVLVGTQDQLLSRALNRGYSMSRYEWPVHFGLLNQDCHWIVDEVQLMGPGLWTTAQLDWMRRKRFKSIKPCRTTWMSATMNPSFLSTTDRRVDQCDTVPVPNLTFNDPSLAKRRQAVRQVLWALNNNLNEIAKQVVQAHQPGTLSLVVCNTVEAAVTVFGALPDEVPKILLTSRFRGQDREEHEKRLLEFERERRNDSGSIRGNPGLICVSTQVVEAGLDISSHHLWSELAPWPSVIQRLGRLNRDGCDADARAWFWETPKPEGKGKKKQDRVGPYPAADIELAKTLLSALIPVSEKPFTEALAELQTALKETLDAALKPKPEPMPRALDVHGLFATEPDAHGGFTDVSAFVRSMDPDADVTVFWREWSGKKSPPPAGEALDGPDLNLDREGCQVPVFRLREFLSSQKAVAWGWNDEAEQWEAIRPGEIRPGMALMLHREIGGYDSCLGWTGDQKHQLTEAPRAGRGRALRDDLRTEAGVWVPLKIHLQDAKSHAEKICDGLQLGKQYRTAVVEASALHDIGKALPRWQRSLPSASGFNGGPWAKCPKVLAVDAVEASDAIQKAVRALRPACLELPPEPRGSGKARLIRLRWAVSVQLTWDQLKDLRQRPGVRWAGHVAFRPGLRHEAASALAMWRNYRNGAANYPALAVYLAAAHHGKVRTVLRSIMDEGNDVFGVPPGSAFELDGFQWPLDFSIAKDGAEGNWSQDGFELRGFGWTALVSDLLGPWRPDDASHCGAVPDTEPKRLGPFVLAYLEALVRAADWRASAQPSHCIKPEETACEQQPA